MKLGVVFFVVAMSPVLALAYDPTVGAKAYWKFDETSGTILNDTSTNHNNGTIVGNVFRESAGKIGGALQFTNAVQPTPDYVLIPTQTYTATQSWTFSMWLKTAKKDWSGFFGGYTDDGGCWLWHNDGYLTFQTDASTYWYFVNVKLGVQAPTNDWFHLTVVSEPNLPSSSSVNMKVYINGELKDTLSNIPLPTLQTRFKYIGAIQDSYNIGQRWFDGEMDEVGIWDRALEEQEIKDLAAYPIQRVQYNNPYGEADAYWNCNELNGPYVYDVTTNNHDGTLYGNIVRVADGKVRGGLNFTNTAVLLDYVGFSMITYVATQAWTYTMWQKTAKKEWSGFFGRGLSNGGYWMWHNSGKLTFHNSEWPQYFENVQLDVNVPTNDWFHLAVVCEPNLPATDRVNFTVYINGVQKDTLSNVLFPTADTSFRWMGIGDDGSRWFAGSMDEVSIWRRALTAAEIRTLMIYPHGGVMIQIK